jgi:hypothetical protein
MTDKQTRDRAEFFYRARRRDRIRKRLQAEDGEGVEGVSTEQTQRGGPARGVTNFSKTKGPKSC